MFILVDHPAQLIINVYKQMQVTTKFGSNHLGKCVTNDDDDVDVHI